MNAASEAICPEAARDGSHEPPPIQWAYKARQKKHSSIVGSILSGDKNGLHDFMILSKPFYETHFFAQGVECSRAEVHQS